jgi:hypothetical protein
LRLSIHEERSGTLACVLLAIAVTVVAWGAVPWGTFQFDDFRNVVRDPATTELAVLLERLPHGLRPLTRLSYFLDAQLYGMQPAGLLSTNLLLHLVSVLLVFALARRRLSSTGALLAALFFAVQPANAEVVAYVSGRSTGLMTPLLLAGLLLYDRQRTSSALLFFGLACLAKEHALIFPMLVLVWELTRTESRPAAVRAVLLAAIAAGVVSGILFSLESYRALVSHALADRSIGQSLLANGRAIPEMLSLWVRPWALSADHEFNPHLRLAASLAGLLFLAGAALVAFALRRRSPILALAILWSLVALLPTNSVLAKPDLVTEKPLYLAWVGPSFAIGAALSALFSAIAHRAARPALMGFAAVLLFALIGASVWRASLWRDPVALWTDAVAKAPYKSRCWNNLGMASLVAQREAEAVLAFQRAVFLDPANEYASLNLATARAVCRSECYAPWDVERPRR